MIRPASASDAPTLVTLSAQTGFFKPHEIDTLEAVLADYFHSTRDDYGHRCIVWADHDTIIGYLYYAPEEMTDRTWYVWWMAVATSRQGQGIGRQLLQFAEHDIHTMGGRLVVIETSDTAQYEPTRRFYLRCGYAATAHIPDFYADGDGMVIFTKRLEVVSKHR
ncbi:MAG: GNAT family N-acetyltransferase [Gemmataceae bacterium]|nr:GNAT family N-acetyltransferase [Gemmata sp.]MDW8196145.1 GNAT family N-acetyltransferase [Gemmataceae bacterium]